MIIAGWGKKAKKMAFVGINKCPRCKNYVAMELYELANRVSLYFIPVAKFNKKYYVVCSLCENGFEVDEKAKQDFLQASAALPNESQVVDVWNEIVKLLEQKTSNYRKSQKNFMNQIIKELLPTYPPDTVYYVVERFSTMVSDKDKPK